jgi:hypothetical protein
MAEPFLTIDASDIAVAAGQVIRLKVDDQGKTLSVVVDCLSTSFETYSRFTMLAESAVGDNGREPVDTAGKYRHRGVESAVITGWSVGALGMGLLGLKEWLVWGGCCITQPD